MESLEGKSIQEILSYSFFKASHLVQFNNYNKLEAAQRAHNLKWKILKYILINCQCNLIPSVLSYSIQNYFPLYNSTPAISIKLLISFIGPTNIHYCILVSLNTYREYGVIFTWLIQDDRLNITKKFEMTKKFIPTNLNPRTWPKI